MERTASASASADAAPGENPGLRVWVPALVGVLSRTSDPRAWKRTPAGNLPCSSPRLVAAKERRGQSANTPSLAESSLAQHESQT